MVILQVHVHYREPGGEDTVVRAEAELLRSAGHTVIEHRAANSASATGAALQLALSSWNPFAAREVTEVLRRHRPELVHVHNTWYALSPSVLRAAGSAGVPVVMTLHNYRLVCANALLYRDGRPCEDCVGRLPWPGVVHRCYRGSLAASTAVGVHIGVHRARGTWEREVDLFLALNEFGKGRFVAAGLPPERILVKPNFVEDPGARRSSPSASSRVLFVGRLSEEKGILSLLGDWERAHRRAPHLELVVVGDGPLRSRMEGREMPGVTLAGRLPAAEVARLMRTSRALAFPSRWYEGQPMVVLEALAAGLPVLGSDLGGIAEAVGALGADWLVPPDRSWEEPLAGLADDRRVDRAGLRARALYEEHYTPARALRHLEDAYGLALERAGG